MQGLHQGLLQVRSLQRYAMAACMSGVFAFDHQRLGAADQGIDHIGFAVHGHSAQTGQQVGNDHAVVIGQVLQQVGRQQVRQGKQGQSLLRQSVRQPVHLVM